MSAHGEWCDGWHDDPSIAPGDDDSVPCTGQCISDPLKTSNLAWLRAMTAKHSHSSQ